MPMQRVPIARPKLQDPEAIMKYLRLSHESRHYTNGGPVLSLYRQELAAYLHVDPEQIVILCNATLCIQGLVTVIGLDHWTIPDYTFAATGAAVLSAGKTLSLVDVQPETFQMPLTSMEEALRQGAGTILVMPFGASCDPTEWGSPKNVIYDAAASLANPVNSLAALHADSAAVFSVHATKVLGAGEGGIAVCGSVELARSLSAWSTFGFVEGRESSVAGTNAKMPEASAAVGLASLELRDEELSTWASLRNVTNEITERFLPLNLTQRTGGATPYWLLQLPSSETNLELASFFESRRIETRKWWPKPLSQMRFFSEKTENVRNGTAELLSATHLGLPFFLELSTQQLELIGSALEDFFQ